MQAIGQDEIADKNGRNARLRKDLINALAKRQQTDGSWTNAETPGAGTKAIRT